MKSARPIQPNLPVHPCRRGGAPPGRNRAALWLFFWRRVFFGAGVRRTLAVGASLAAPPETGQLLASRRHEPWGVLVGGGGFGSVRRVDVCVRFFRAAALRIAGAETPDAPGSSPLTVPVTWLLFVGPSGLLLFSNRA